MLKRVAARLHETPQSTAQDDAGLPLPIGDLMDPFDRCANARRRFRSLSRVGGRILRPPNAQAGTRARSH